MFKSYNFIFPAHLSLLLAYIRQLLCILHVSLTHHLMHISNMSINFYCLQAGMQRELSVIETQGDFWTIVLLLYVKKSLQRAHAQSHILAQWLQENR